MDVRTLGLPCALLFSALLLVSGSLPCVPQALPDMVIDVSQAMARGARFTDPLSVTSVQECLTACCSHQDARGDHDCNLLVFDPRKDPGLQNCYIFHCPRLDSCPLTPSPGVLSYSLWSDTSRPEKHDHDKSSDGSKAPGKTSGPSGKKNAAAIASQGSAKHSDSSKSITTQLLHLADKVDRRLEKMESESKDPAGDLQVHYPSPAAAIEPRTQATTIVIPLEVKKVPSKGEESSAKKPNEPDIYPTTKAAGPVGTTTKTVARTKAGPTVPPAAPQDGSGAKKPPSMSDRWPTVTPKKGDHPPPHTEAHHTRPPHVVTHLAPVWTSPTTKTIDERKSLVTPPPARREPAAVNLEEAPGKGVGSGVFLPSLEDRSGLVAALVFGMLFLMVVIGQVSRKVSEARRRHRYTKLDYLINGMYVDT